MTIRVLHVGKFYPPVSGGIERVVQLLCQGAPGRIDSRVLVGNTAAKTSHDDVQGVPVTRAASLGTIGSVAVCPTFPWWLRRLSTDVMVIHEPNPMALVSHWLARPRAHVVVWFHSEVVRPRWKYRLLYRPFLRRVLRLADRIVVSSPRLAEYAEELQDFRNKCVVIPFGIDPSRLAETDVVRKRAEAIRQEYGEPLALFVGRLVPYKGVDVLLRALVGTNMKAVLVGGGPLRAALERLAFDLGLGGQVAFAGEVSDEEIVAMYHGCDLFVLPSVTRAEAFGVVQLEAMTCGKPVISTLLPSGVPWVNQDGRTGLVVTPGDVVALRHALKRLASEPMLRRKMGAAGRLRVSQEFLIDQMIERMTALVHTIHEGDGPTSSARLLQPALEHPDVQRK